jgi:hypothetical protein
MPAAALTANEADAYFVEMAQITGLTVKQWQDILAEDPAYVPGIIADWQALEQLSWAAQPTVLSRVLTILNIFAAVASPVTVIAGGVSGVGAAIAALKSL